MTAPKHRVGSKGTSCQTGRFTLAQGDATLACGQPGSICDAARAEWARAGRGVPHEERAR